MSTTDSFQASLSCYHDDNNNSILATLDTEPENPNKTGLKSPPATSTPNLKTLTTVTNPTITTNQPTVGSVMSDNIGSAGGGSNTGQNLICQACQSVIMDQQFLLGDGKSWHINCLRCSDCGVVLVDVGSSYFVRQSRNFCRIDYIKYFGSTGVCHKCNHEIQADELIMRSTNHIYHLVCFCCFSCHRQLQPGSRYAMLNDHLYCERDYYSQFLQTPPIPSTNNKAGNPGNCSFNTNNNQFNYYNNNPYKFDESFMNSKNYDKQFSYYGNYTEPNGQYQPHQTNNNSSATPAPTKSSRGTSNKKRRNSSQIQHNKTSPASSSSTLMTT